MSSIPITIIPAVTKRLSQALGQPVRILSFKPITGGCINNGGLMSTDSGNYFIKWNIADKYFGMFEAEAKGLRLLSAAKSLRIPDVIAHGEQGNIAFLVLEFIASAPRQQSYWQTMGQRLAALHGHTSDAFGLSHHNFIGSLHQYNDPDPKWLDFFIARRLRPQVSYAVQNQRIEKRLEAKFEALYQKLETLIPTGEKPALLHGDLWSGNQITDDQGMPCLIDPAVYYGHREVEIAFTSLFGGFDKQFYEAYQEATPLLPGFEGRRDLYNLYPLMVHVNLFGGGYTQQVAMILKQFE